MFQNTTTGSLVPISGIDPLLGSWQHRAFVPAPLPNEMPTMTSPTFLAIADARAALAALDSTSRQLPNPTLLRLPTLRREAQSTSALEGTYAPLSEVLTADEDNASTAELIEILNYVRMANLGFARIADGQAVTVSLLSELQGVLMQGTPLQSVSGRVRDGQVVIGRRADADPVSFAAHAARFIPSPPGIQLEASLRDLADWMQADRANQIDPVVAAAMSHYQFEALHPFRDGNGRLGRFLIVLHLQLAGVLGEPTLTVSPWFEARRTEYYDRLFSVSAQGDWDGFVRFFARGLQAAADQTRLQMVALVGVQAELKDRIRASALRADSARALVDLAVANPSFTVRKVEAELGLSYARANNLVGQLVELGILQQAGSSAYDRRFFAPRVLQTLTADAR
jgi:Fic family protein